MMKTFTEIVEEAKKERILENIQTLREEIGLSWVKEKVSKHVEKCNNLFTEESLIEGILTNDIIASSFCKDPSKQNISENLAAELLRVAKLPANGQNSVRFNEEGKIVGVSKKMPGLTKSADFKFNDIYFTQKYTRERGGAQDNQHDDVVEFLTKGSVNHKVGAIVDGEYWTEKREELKEYFKNNENVVVLSMDDILRGDYVIENC